MSNKKIYDMPMISVHSFDMSDTTNVGTASTLAVENGTVTNASYGKNGVIRVNLRR
jgi:hypothetical protein